MANRDEVSRTDEEVRFAEINSWPLAIQRRRAQDDEERVAVALELGPLMGAVGVFDREVVQAELLLDLPEQRFARLVEPDPEEPVRLLEDLADVLDLDVGDPPAGGVGGAINDRAHDARWQRRVFALSGDHAIVAEVPDLIRAQAELAQDLVGMLPAVRARRADGARRFG